MAQSVPGGGDFIDTLDSGGITHQRSIKPGRPVVPESIALFVTDGRHWHPENLALSSSPVGLFLSHKLLSGFAHCDATPRAQAYISLHAQPSVERGRRGNINGPFGALNKMGIDSGNFLG
jgi:hypothetical protein